jgi:hypothetical protein
VVRSGYIAVVSGRARAGALAGSAGGSHPSLEHSPAVAVVGDGEELDPVLLDRVVKERLAEAKIEEDFFTYVTAVRRGSKLLGRLSVTDERRDERRRCG